MTYYNFVYLTNSKIFFALGLILMGVGAGVIVFQQYSPHPDDMTSFIGGLLWSVGAILTGYTIYRLWSNRVDNRLAEFR